MVYKAMPRALRCARLLIDTTRKEQHIDTYTQLAHRRHHLPLKGELEGSEEGRAKLSRALDRLDDD